MRKIKSESFLTGKSACSKALRPVIPSSMKRSTCRRSMAFPAPGWRRSSRAWPRTSRRSATRPSRNSSATATRSPASWASSASRSSATRKRRRVNTPSSSVTPSSSPTSFATSARTLVIPVASISLRKTSKSSASPRRIYSPAFPASGSINCSISSIAAPAVTTAPPRKPSRQRIASTWSPPRSWPRSIRPSWRSSSIAATPSSANA